MDTKSVCGSPLARNQSSGSTSSISSTTSPIKVLPYTIRHWEMLDCEIHEEWRRRRRSEEEDDSDLRSLIDLFPMPPTRAEWREVGYKSSMWPCLAFRIQKCYNSSGREKCSKLESPETFSSFLVKFPSASVLPIPTCTEKVTWWKVFDPLVTMKLEYDNSETITINRIGLQEGSSIYSYRISRFERRIRKSDTRGGGIIKSVNNCQMLQGIGPWLQWPL